MNSRIVITGMGVVSSAGSDLAVFGNAVQNGISCLYPISDGRISHFHAKYAGLIRELPALRFVSPSLSGTIDRYVLLALAAAEQAYVQSGLSNTPDNHTLGIVAATCSGPMLTIENYYHQLFQKQTVGNADQWFNRRYFSAARILAHLLGISGVNYTVTTACSASVNALGTACGLISSGHAGAILAGGADTFSITTLSGFEGLKATSHSRCAPFSKPLGMNLGEGAGFVVVESFESAQERGAKIIAEIIGYGSSNDAFHCTAPDATGKGQSLAMQRALLSSRIDPASIAYVNAHGTGTEANDKAETKALKRVFGEGAYRIPISSSKGIFGHCLGAAGMLELIGTILCARNGAIPPTANFSEPRDGCDLDYVPMPGRQWTRSKIFMNNNFAFGGNNASVIVSIDPVKNADDKNQKNIEAVWITGIGIVSPLGIGKSAFHAGISTADQSNPLASFKSKRTCIESLDLRAIDKRLDAKGFDRASQFAAAAASLALADARYGKKHGDRADLGFYMHTAHAPHWAEAEHVQMLLRDQYHITQLTAFPYVVPNSVAGNVCRALELSGHNCSFCLGPGAGILGLGLAIDGLINGSCPAILSGASDELNEYNLPDVAFGLRQLGDGALQPAEGAVMLLLETGNHANARQALPLAVIKGWEQSVDIQHVDTNDDNTGTAGRTINHALEQAGISFDQIDIVCSNYCSARESMILSSIDKAWGSKRKDISRLTGYTETCQSILNLAYQLESNRIEQSGSTKYILTFFSSPSGYNCAYVLATGKG